MIEVTEKTTTLKGTKLELVSEFCCLVHYMVTKDDSTDKPLLTMEELNECIKIATMPKELLDMLVLALT